MLYYTHIGIRIFIYTLAHGVVVKREVRWILCDIDLSLLFIFFFFFFSFSFFLPTLSCSHTPLFRLLLLPRHFLLLLHYTHIHTLLSLPLTTTAGTLFQQENRGNCYPFRVFRSRLHYGGISIG